MATSMVSGNDGRVYVDDAIVATVKSWSLPAETAAILVPNFESPVDGLGRVWPEVLPGTSTGKIQLAGQFNVDLTDKTDGIITNGVYVTCDLLFVKDAPFGFQGVYGLVSNFKSGSTIENQAASFECEIATSGIVPQSGLIT